MPTIINGIGTWYCGKRRVHRVKSGCPHCGAFSELESYDTTLCFVVVMIPVLPLSSKRILNSCPVCQKHQVIGLKQWEAAKGKAFNDILEKLKANPDDRETIQTALGLATVYQDELLFDKLADALAGHRTDDAEIQSQLGGAYEYFSRWADAEVAYRRALAVHDTPDIRERLAVALLKQGRPDEAASYLRHVFESSDPDKAWLSFWLVEGFMARGMHDEALRVMDVRDQLYPKLATTKDYQKQRRTADKNEKTGRPVRSVYLAESNKTGFRQGSRLGFGWPKYVAAAFALGLIALYLGSCFYRGQHRPVYVVNGWTKPYTVTVNREAHQLSPGAHKRIDVEEGDVTIEWPGDIDGPQTVRIETGFFGRPFNRPVFVLNPDRVALVVCEETVYSDNPTAPERPDELHTGKLLHELPDVDYEFQPFPNELRAKKGSKITKTRVDLVTVASVSERLFQVTTNLGLNGAVDYARRLLQLDPDDGPTLAFLAAVLPSAEAMALLKPGLAVRPIRVEWHRRYQHLSEIIEPARDLRPEYGQLVTETNRAPDAVYLLGRLEDSPEADKLYREAANGTPPSAHACSGLAARLLSRGEFAPAVEWANKAYDLRPNDLGFRHWRVQSLQAAERWQDLLQATAPTGPGDSAIFLRERLTAHVALGERGAADGELGLAGPPVGLQRLGPDAVRMLEQMRLRNELTLAEVKRDRAKYLELTVKLIDKDQFTESLLRGSYKSAAVAGRGTVGPKEQNVALNWEIAATQSGLLYLAGRKANDAAFADEQWKKLLAALGRGDRDGRLFAAMAGGQQPFDVTKAKAAAVGPNLKRVILSALARKFPEHAAELNTLAKKLDFERDAVSLCLRYVTE